MSQRGTSQTTVHQSSTCHGLHPRGERILTSARTNKAGEEFSFHFSYPQLHFQQRSWYQCHLPSPASCMSLSEPAPAFPTNKVSSDRIIKMLHTL